MGYAVFHRDEAGTPTVEDVTSLEAALEIVERSRNGEGPRDVRVFREVPIEVRTYYKVQVAEDAETPVAVTSAPSAETGPVAEPVAAEPAVDDTVPVTVVADEPVLAEVTSTGSAPVVDEVPLPDEAADVDGPVEVTVAADEPYDVRRLLEPAPPAHDSVRPATPPAALPGAFPLAGPAVQQPTVEVHAANLEDEDGPGKRHSLFGRGG